MSGDWITWIIQSACTIGIGVIGWYYKRNADQQREVNAQLTERVEKSRAESTQAIKELDHKHEERIKQLELRQEDCVKELDHKHEERLKELELRQGDRIKELDDKLNATIQQMPYLYVLREDYLRTVAAHDKKLDNILDEIMRLQAAKK